MRCCNDGSTAPRPNPGTLVLTALLIGLTACAAQDAADGPAIPTGTYELEASMDGQAFPVRLELIDAGDRPWGRLTVVAGQERVVAVRGTGVDEDGVWRFAAGGPVHGLELRVADPVSGTLLLGGAPPIPLEGTRAGELGDADAEALRAHHVLDPIGLAARAGEEGASFATGLPDGTLIFARHGPDLSRQTLMIAEPARAPGAGSGGGGDGWDEPRIMSVSGEYSDRSPFVLPDGSGLIFASDRPVDVDDDGGDGFEGYRLWFTPRTGQDGWGSPSPVRFDGGWEHDARQPSITADGTLYFSSNAPGGSGEGDIYAAAPAAPGRWSTPRNLGEPINGPGDENGAFVAPDGSYMILTSAGERPGRTGGDDLYVSRRTDDGWSEPMPLDLPVNTYANEYGPWVSTADGALYFTSDRYGYAAIFRLDAEQAGLPTPAR